MTAVMFWQLTLKLKPLLITVFVAALANAQRDIAPDSLLEIVGRNYSQVKYYRIEARLSEDWKGELSGNWSNSFQTAIVAQDGRYRFEARGPRYSWLQISNGRTEWIYNAATAQYVSMRTSPSQPPSQFNKDSWSFEESQLVDTQGVPQHVAQEIGSVRDSVLVRSEMLSLDKGDIECFVIRGPGKYKSGWSPDTTLEVTFWVEKATNFVRKIEEHWKGKLIKGDPSDYTRTNVEVYPIVELDNPAVVPEFFEFQPPPGATLISTFRQTHPSLRPQRSHLLGTTAPEVDFHSRDGHDIMLSSMRGKPILIEFWATWCRPCTAAFPRLEHLYSQAIGQGVSVVTVDEDEQPEKADAFLAAHLKSSWPNYHDDGEINRSLPGDGLPQFVLIDAKGKIVFATSGFDEDELRTALTRLGSAYTSLAKKAN
jgi:thiol-disulfide isomerase/thioredoxin